MCWIESFNCHKATLRDYYKDLKRRPHPLSMFGTGTVKSTSSGGMRLHEASFSVCLCLCLCVFMYVCLNVCVSDCLCVWMSECLTVCVSECLTVCVSGCLCVLLMT